MKVRRWGSSTWGVRERKKSKRERRKKESAVLPDQSLPTTLCVSVFQQSAPSAKELFRHPIDQTFVRLVAFPHCHPAAWRWKRSLAGQQPDGMQCSGSQQATGSGDAVRRGLLQFVYGFVFHQVVKSSNSSSMLFGFRRLGWTQKNPNHCVKRSRGNIETYLCLRVWLYTSPISEIVNWNSERAMMLQSSTYRQEKQDKRLHGCC